MSSANALQLLYCVKLGSVCGYEGTVKLPAKGFPLQYNGMETLNPLVRLVRGGKSERLFGIAEFVCSNNFTVGQRGDCCSFLHLEKCFLGCWEADIFLLWEADVVFLWRRSRSYFLRCVLM